MMGFLGKFVLGVVSIPVLVVAYLWLAETTWHEAVALEVETPAGLKTGRAVVSVSFGENLFVPGFSGRGMSYVKGEATVVEVAPGQFLFALMHSEYLSQNVFKELSSGDNWKSNLARARATREIPPKMRPLLVRFRDIKDPKTVEKVDPDNLAASFGPGFRLKSYTLQLLRKDEPVTRGEVEKVLGWLNHLEQYRTDPNNIFTSTLPAEIRGFRSGK